MRKLSRYKSLTVSKCLRRELYTGFTSLMDMLAKSTLVMSSNRPYSRVVWRASLKGVTSPPVMRSTEYRAVSAESVLLVVLLVVVLSVAMTAMEFTLAAAFAALSVGVGVGAVVAAGTGFDFTVAAGADLAVVVSEG